MEICTIVNGRVKAFVLINVRSGFEESSLERIKQLEQVASMDAIFGKYDFHIVVYFEPLKDLDDFVMNTLRGIEGVYQTTTLLSVEM